MWMGAGWRGVAELGCQGSTRDCQHSTAAPAAERGTTSSRSAPLPPPLRLQGDGRYLISNSKDQTVKLWDTRWVALAEGGALPAFNPRLAMLPTAARPPLCPRVHLPAVFFPALPSTVPSRHQALSTSVSAPPRWDTRRRMPNLFLLICSTNPPPRLDCSNHCSMMQGEKEAREQCRAAPTFSWDYR